MNYKELKYRIKKGDMSDFDLIQHLTLLKSYIKLNNYELLKLFLINNNVIVFNYFTENKKLTDIIEEKWFKYNKNKINKEIVDRYKKELSLNLINNF